MNIFRCIVYLLGLLMAFMLGAYASAPARQKPVPPVVTATKGSLLKAEHELKIAQLVILGNQFQAALAEQNTLDYAASDNPEVRNFLVEPASRNAASYASQIGELTDLEVPLQILATDLDKARKAFEQYHSYRERPEVVSKN